MPEGGLLFGIGQVGVDVDGGETVGGDADSGADGAGQIHDINAVFIHLLGPQAL